MVRRLIGRALDKLIQVVLTRVRRQLDRDAWEKATIAPLYLDEDLFDIMLRRKTHRLAAADRGTQILLALAYQFLLRNNQKLPSLNDVEFRCFSQFGEDGILHFIFSLVGTTNKRCVEICAGNGRECNSANLIINHGWNGLLLDGDEANIQRAGLFYTKCQDTYLARPKIVHAWIKTDNVNEILRSNGCQGEIDLLSLDMDGVDYWIWKAVDCITPRVVMLEFNSLWGPEGSYSISYRPDFERDRTNSVTENCFGASLSAFVKLGREKGYRLIGCPRAGLNAVFMRHDVGQGIFAEVTPAACFEEPMLKSREFERVWFAETQDKTNWLEV